MIDCSDEITEFHNKHVRLTKSQTGKLANYRETNINRLEAGLTKNEDPLPDRHINQGSYAMHTINQHSSNDYDIDVGVIFKKDDLIGSQGADKTALNSRKMVLEAIQDQKFKTPPELKKNCVRVHYNEGHHVDMPVYRESTDDFGIKLIELASNEWIETDPEAVTTWFNRSVIDKSPDETNGRQMRRIVRLIKFWAKSRSSWNMPSGFIISKLVDEKYISINGRDDESLLKTMDQIKNRLIWNKTIYHPVLPDVAISEGKETAINELADRLEVAIDDLSVLLDDCTMQEALKAWKKFFNHDYFSEKLKALAAAAVAPTIIAKETPASPVQRKGDSRFGK